MSGKKPTETTDVMDFKRINKIDSSSKTNSSVKNDTSAENLCRSCLSVTSAHGFPRLIHNSKMERIFWSFVMMIAVISCALHLFTLFHAYFKYSYHTTFSFENTSPHFPCVTICDNTVIQTNFEVSETKYIEIASKFKRFIMNHTETEENKMKVAKKLRSVNTLLANLDENDKIESILADCRYKGKTCSGMTLNCTETLII